LVSHNNKGRGKESKTEAWKKRAEGYVKEEGGSLELRRKTSEGRSVAT